MAGDDPQQTSPRAIANVLDSFRRRDPRAAARCAKLALTETNLAPATRTALLHLSGVACHAAGFDEDGTRFLAEAARLEREELGCEHGSQHTVHQLSLLNQKEAGLAAVKRYYLKTLKNLRSSHALGAGLCLRSLGEIALVAGAVSEAEVCWRRASRYLEPSAAAEASQIDDWIRLLEVSSR